jgi:hypothetical protein
MKNPGKISGAAGRSGRGGKSSRSSQLTMAMKIAMKGIEESYEIRLDYGMASRSLGKLFECQVSARHCTR